MSDNACPTCGAPLEPRSWASHGHYFAELHDKYSTMPGEVTERLPTFEAFRKFCLIKTGWRDETSYPCPTRAEAERWAKRLRGDDFAIITITGTTIVKWTAKSQSMRAMGRQNFQRSKDDVLGYADHLLGIGTSAAELKHAEAA